MLFQYVFFFCIYPVILYLSIYLGGLYAKRRIKLNKIWKSIGLESSLVSIYALLLSFSLVLSSNHAEKRNDEIYAVADKLSILVKKSKYHDTTIKNSLQVYLKGFFEIHDQNLKTGRITKEKVISKLMAIDQQLDDRLIAYQKLNPEKSHEIDQLTSYTSDLRSSYIRLTENYDQSTPTVIIIILIFYSLLIAGLIGFMTIIDNNQTYVLSAIFLVISTIMVAAIWDLDHPNLGFIRPNYQSITEISRLFSQYLKNQ